MATSSKKRPKRSVAPTNSPDNGETNQIDNQIEANGNADAATMPDDNQQEATAVTAPIATTGASSAEDMPTLKAAKKIAAPETRELPAVEMDATNEPHESVASSTSDDETTRVPLTSRPKKTTLAMAITKSSSAPKSPLPDEAYRQNDAAAAGGQPDYPTLPPVGPGEPIFARTADAQNTVPAAVADEVDEWSIADQPTIYLPPKLKGSPRPAYLDDDQLPLRPPATNVLQPPAPQRPIQQRPIQPRPIQPRPQPPISTPTPRQEFPGRDYRGAPARPIPNGLRNPQRFASPDGRPMPATPPTGVPRAALPDPRMERFQHLREGRMAHEEGERAPDEPRPVAEKVRQWWRDLRPNLNNALNYQREARASGAHPIPAYEEPASGGRLGDAFGRLAASAREMTERAQNVIAPRFNRLQELHDHAENAANAFVQKLEGPSTRQQAPLLGPGRIAVFFKQGVTIGQAQALLGASHARPIRLIPRKHGFLAMVPPGAEADISERLRVHAYVRDVAYLEYDEYGEAITPN